MIAVAILTLGIIGASVYVHRVYFAHLDHVDDVLAALPPAEANPPATFARAVRVVDSTYSLWVASSFVAETSPQPLPMYQWHLRNWIWWTLLSRRLSDDQLLSLYAHFIQFEGGRGLTYGARHHFGEDPAALNLHQVVELLVISRAPSVYSRAENRERLEKQIESRMALLASPAT